ncbi:MULTISPECIES: phosphatase PAP2 family protein [Micromonospora]|uniref:Phosphatase PAP2 family protein n=1 Tax=Micromonospora solifontis TaxID=2487138 RepID=A0ABX9WKG8_9ACTN|nr:MULTISPECIES: phosphatase PAP2 family protein [Micromonospora]NES14731.1 phosphatase PAP2 family protein [Micromonospora sp. PPF5-17B]NES36712.1 phosphatase PAP2 family protein [Micromonospora solifontis]NES55739.1 phosphatase PAP2 family protein [Micromonospora sp. PPF5-6]RNL99173.1 phosphatase PAP2 family protein [Micromonospora solifontis]
MSDVVVQVARRILLPMALLFSVMVALGLLVTRVLAKSWPFTVEDTVNRELAADRTPGWNDVSLVFSTLASTQLIVVVTVLVALVLRLVLHRWREPLFLCAAVSAQALIFLFTTMVIDRQRPAVEHMDSSPPTSSFPSGHTSAATALYVGIAVLLALRARSTPARIAWWSLLVVVPVGVALTRMYRGMHHPSDVVASFLNGGTCVAIMARAVLDRTRTWDRAKLPVGRSGDDVAPAAASAG